MDGIVCSIVRSYLSEDRLHRTTRIKHVPVTQSNSQNLSGTETANKRKLQMNKQQLQHGFIWL